jgi:hypothetical protein
MSKTIIPFRDPDKWQTKEDCLFCQTIDRLYNIVPKLTTTEEQQQTLFRLDDNLLVNGYELVNTLEGIGEAINHPNNIDRVALYPDNTEKFMAKVHNVMYPTNIVNTSNMLNLDEPVLIHSRWCKKCSRRKPDIFDSSHNSNYNCLPITNLFTEIKEEGIKITWLDCTTEIWDYTELKKSINADMSNYEIITSYGLEKGRNYYEKEGFLDVNVEKGQIYYYQVINYDVTRTILRVSDILEVYDSTNDITPPQPITDFAIEQVREIDSEDFTTKDYLLMTWTNPSDEDYAGTMIRMGSLELTPPTENDGIETSARRLIKLPNEIDTYYYFKPFPYDKWKYKPREIGIGYYQYRNFNRNSNSVYFKVLSQIDNVSNIKKIVEDEAVKISWTDPIDENWKGTMIRYKKGGMILNKNDGILLTTVDVKNYYKEKTLLIPNLENNVEYCIGIFPISKDGLVNVTPENQINIITGYYHDDVNITFEDNCEQRMTYLGRFKVIKDKVRNTNVLTNPIINVDERTICFIEATDFKYGGMLSFDYATDIIPEWDHCNVYINGEQLVSFTGIQNWKNFSYEIPQIDYIKLTFEWIRTYPQDTNSWIKIDNIKMIYNNHQI